MFAMIPDELLTDNQVKMKKEAIGWRAKAALQNALPFDQIVPPRTRRDVGIIAESYHPENPLSEVFPDVPRTTSSREQGLLHSSGELSYSLFMLPKGRGLEVTPSRDMWSDGGQAFFTEDIPIPVLRYKQTTYDWDVWMSLTPNEIWTQRSGIQAATGEVVIGGLGMGWLMRQVAKKKSVTKITVVEKDPCILEWYGEKICACTDKVVDVICGDIYDVAPKFNLKKTKFLLDIWPSSSGAEFDSRLTKLRDSGARVWAWGQARAPKKYTYDWKK